MPLEGQSQAQAAIERPFFARTIALRDIPRRVREYFIDVFHSVPVGGSVQRRAQVVDSETEQIVELKMHGLKERIDEVPRRVVEHGAQRSQNYWSYQVTSEKPISDDEFDTNFVLVGDTSENVVTGPGSKELGRKKKVIRPFRSSRASDSQSEQSFSTRQSESNASSALPLALTATKKETTGTSRASDMSSDVPSSVESVYKECNHHYAHHDETCFVEKTLEQVCVAEKNVEMTREQVRTAQGRVHRLRRDLKKTKEEERAALEDEITFAEEDFKFLKESLEKKEESLNYWKEQLEWGKQRADRESSIAASSFLPAIYKSK